MAACGVVLASTLVESRALGGDPALAEQLFRQAKELAAQGRHAEACAKFYESQHQDPGVGTLLAVAQCHDAEGKIATAWAEYIEVRTASEERRPDRVKIAQGAIARLEPRLPKLMVRLSPDASAVSGLTVALDGAALGTAALGADLPVDPGEHLVAAEAPGRERWTTQVRLEERELHTVLVPFLEPVPPPRPGAAAETPAGPSPATSVVAPPVAKTGVANDGATKKTTVPATPPAGPSWETVAGLLVGGAGVVSLGFGTFFGLRAVSFWSDFKKRCTPPTCDDPAAQEPYDNAHTAASLSNVFFGVGAAAVAAGTVLFFVGRRTPASPQIGPGVLSPTGASAVLRAAW
jgi:serine/threonine-protein kinase